MRGTEDGRVEVEGPAADVAVEVEALEVEEAKLLLAMTDTTGEAATCLPLPLRAALVTAVSDVLREFIVAWRNRVSGAEEMDRWR